MFALKKPRQMAIAKPRSNGERVDVDTAYQRMMAKLPKTFEHLAK